MALLTPVPKSSPAQQPFAVGPSKNVVRLLSKTLAMVLPELLYEPDVPMTAPASSVKLNAATALFAVSPPPIMTLTA